jgi:hypothetical protein
VSEAGWPDWSPDVRKLAFDAAEGGRVFTFVVDPEGSAAATYEEPTWRP